ncbi:MAG: TenA family protein [Bacteroidales bacterium]
MKRILPLLILLVFCLNLNAQNTQDHISRTLTFETPQNRQFSDVLWDSIRPIYKEIIHCDFIQKLTKGKLERDAFDYYLSQDSLYLIDDYKAFKILSDRVTQKDHKVFFHAIATHAITAEQEMHQSYLGSNSSSNQIVKSETTTEYTNLLLDHANNSPTAVAAAALLPCFWIYYELGNYLIENSSSQNPYQNWIDTYKGASYEKQVRQFITIVNQMAKDSNEDVQKQMIRAFIQASKLELDFFKQGELVLTY